MSTNEIIALARETIRKLGRNAEKLQIDKTPELQGPYTLPGEVHLPYCRVECKLNSSKEPSEQDSFSHIEINTEKCEVVGFYLQLSGENVEKMANPLKIDLEPVEPEEPQIPQMGADYLLKEMSLCDPYGVCKNVGGSGTGVYDPGLCYGYAPHTLRMRILRMRGNVFNRRLRRWRNYFER